MAPGVGDGHLLICSPDVRSMTGACGRHLHATSCRLLQPLLVSTPLSLSLSDTQTPPPTKTVKSLPKKRHLGVSPLLPLSWIFQCQKTLPIYAPPPLSLAPERPARVPIGQLPMLLYGTGDAKEECSASMIKDCRLPGSNICTTDPGHRTQLPLVYPRRS